MQEAVRHLYETLLLPLHVPVISIVGPTQFNSGTVVPSDESPAQHCGMYCTQCSTDTERWVDLEKFPQHDSSE